MEKNKELTPMMELIDNLNNIIENLPDKFLGVRNQTFIIRARAIELLPKEKQVIIDAFDYGYSTEYTGGNDGQTYYNTKYNNQIK